MGDLASAIENIGIYGITVWAILHDEDNDPKWFIMWVVLMTFVLCVSTVDK